VGRAYKGTLRATRPDELAAVAIKGALERVSQLDPKEIEDVILGCAMPEAEQGMNVARIASLRAGLPVEVSALTINRFCSSGLQAIATARRLGAVTSAYDTRQATKEQVQSLGGRFVELPIEAQNAQDARGYGTAQDETFYARQRELLTRVVAESDVVITAAVIPGKKSPVLITAEMVRGMAPGSVIVDLASERGGNCELTRTGETVKQHGVTIIGAINLASSVPYHASQMYARNLTAFLTYLVKDGKLQLNLQDEISRETLVTRDGEIVNPRAREFYKLPALTPVAG